MQRLLIRNIKTLVSCDEQDTVYENVDLYAEDGVIRAIGPKLETSFEMLRIKRRCMANPILFSDSSILPRGREKSTFYAIALAGRGRI